MEEPKDVPQIKDYRLGLPEDQPPPYDQTTLDTSDNDEPTTVPEAMESASYLGFSIFVTLCCCFPFGCIGIAYSVYSIWQYIDGDMEEAKDTGKSARNYSLAGLVVGIVIYFSLLLEFHPEIFSRTE